MRTRRSSQSGFSLIELMAVLMVLGVAAALAVPKFFGATENGSVQMSRNTVDSAWESAQLYFQGQRGQGQDEGPSSSFSGFDPSAASRLDGKLTWKTAAEGLSPGAHVRQVVIMRADQQTLALCSASTTQVLCKADDGLPVDGQLGPRYGVSASSAADALTHACHRSPQQASAAGSSRSCPLAP